MLNRFQPGQIIRHFKRDFISEEERMQNNHLYQVLAIAINTETNEQMLVYQGLYHPFQVFVRPLEMALEKVDMEKYPDAKQEYRLEVCDEKED